MSVNQCTFIGRVVRDPEIRTTNGGKKIAKFAIAMNRHYKDANGERQRETSFADLEAFAGKAEFVEKHLRAGFPIGVSARMRNDKWTDKDGNKHHKVVFVAENFHFMPTENRDNEDSED